MHPLLRALSWLRPQLGLVFQRDAGTLAGIWRIDARRRLPARAPWQPPCPSHECPRLWRVCHAGISGCRLWAGAPVRTGALGWSLMNLWSDSFLTATAEGALALSEHYMDSAASWQLLAAEAIADDKARAGPHPDRALALPACCCVATAFGAGSLTAASCVQDGAGEQGREVFVAGHSLVAIQQSTSGRCLGALHKKQQQRRSVADIRTTLGQGDMVEEQLAVPALKQQQATPLHALMAAVHTQAMRGCPVVRQGLAVVAG